MKKKFGRTKQVKQILNITKHIIKKLKQYRETMHSYYWRLITKTLVVLSPAFVMSNMSIDIFKLWVLSLFSLLQ